MTGQLQIFSVKDAIYNTTSSSSAGGGPLAVHLGKEKCFTAIVFSESNLPKGPFGKGKMFYCYRFL